MPKKTEVYTDSQGHRKEKIVGQDEDTLVKGKVQAQLPKSMVEKQAPVTDDRPKAADYTNDLPGLQEAWRNYRAKPKKP